MATMNPIQKCVSSSKWGTVKQRELRIEGFTKQKLLITHRRWCFKSRFFLFVKIVKVEMYHRTVMSQVMVMVFHHSIVIRVDASISLVNLVFQVIEPIASGLQPIVVPAVVLQSCLGYQGDIELTLTTFCWAILLDGFVWVSPCGVIQIWSACKGWNYSLERYQWLDNT